MDDNTKKMLAGKPYLIEGTELGRIGKRAHRLCRDYNLTTDDDDLERNAIIDQLFPDHQANTYIQGPMSVDFGRFVHLGKNFYANFNLTILDTCPVRIGDNVFCGPNVSFITALHPLRYQQRNYHRAADGKLINFGMGKPITVGDNCWFATNVTVCPGVTIGNGCVIGAGAVVTKDLPDNSLALGVPAKVVRQITDQDKLKDFPV